MTLPGALDLFLRRFLLAGVLLMVAVAGGYGATLWLAFDSDSFRIVRAAERILAGEYRPSRGVGFPLYEYAAAAAYRIGGVLGINLWAAALSLLSVWLIWLLTRQLSAIRQAACMIAICAHPLFLINASSAMELSQTTVGLLLLLLSTGRLTGRERSYGLFIAGGLILLLTRFDNIIIFAAMVISEIIIDHSNNQYKKRNKIIVLSVVLFGFSFFCYFWLTNGFAGLSMSASADPLWRMFARAGAGVFAVLGPLAIAGIVLIALVARPRLGRGEREVFCLLLIAIATVLYLGRFVMLPDELEYIFPWYLAVALCAAVSLSRSDAICILAASALCANILQLSLFKRSPETLGLSFAPSIQAGALPQDWRARQFRIAIREPAFLAHLSGSVYGGERPGRPTMSVWGTGAFVSSVGDVVVGASTYAANAKAGTMWRLHERASGGRIYRCDGDLEPFYGWRILRPPTSTAALTAARNGEKLSCAIIERRTSEGWAVVPPEPR